MEMRVASVAMGRRRWMNKYAPGAACNRGGDI